MNDHSFLWQQSRDNGSRSRRNRAILLVAHGYGHAMTDCWERNDDTFPECIGLPEERAIVETALNLN